MTTTALGVKVWDGGGVSLKHFFNERNAGELIAYFWSQGIRFTGLYEIHGDITNAAGLKWYIGPGAHVGFIPPNTVTAPLSGRRQAGLDYKFNAAPINISLWQPPSSSAPAAALKRMGRTCPRPSDDRITRFKRVTEPSPFFIYVGNLTR